jgi:hypothetical protein
MSSVTIQVNEPLLSIKEYAARVGESEKVISNQMDDGILPFIQPKERGKRYVNMTALLVLTLGAEERKPKHNQTKWEH